MRAFIGVAPEPFSDAMLSDRENGARRKNGEEKAEVERNNSFLPGKTEVLLSSLSA